MGTIYCLMVVSCTNERLGWKKGQFITINENEYGFSTSVVCLRYAQFFDSETEAWEELKKCSGVGVRYEVRKLVVV